MVEKTKRRYYQEIDAQSHSLRPDTDATVPHRFMSWWVLDPSYTAEFCVNREFFRAVRIRCSGTLVVPTSTTTLLAQHPQHLTWEGWGGGNRNFSTLVS